VFNYECNLVNFQTCLTNSAKIIISFFWKYSPSCDIQSFSFFIHFFKWVSLIFSMYTVQTLENSRTKIFSRLVFSSNKVFFSLGYRKKSQCAKFGEWRCCGSSFQIFSYNGRFVCDETLSCNNLTPRRPLACRRFLKYFFNLWRTLPL
jgi:hypothetical protein